MINKEVALAFFEFVYERQLIYIKKNAGLAHLTKDPIFQKFKFCNIYRQNDTCTKYLKQTVIDNPTLDLQQKLFWIIFYRRFNVNSFWSLFGPRFQLCLKPDFKDMLKSLNQAKANGKKIFNEAYTLCQVPYNKDLPKEKHIQILASMEDIYKQKKLEFIKLHFNPLPYAALLFKNLQFKGHGVGPFLGYQIMQDLSYVKGVKIPGLESFTFVGPGAEPSLKQIYVIQKGATSPPTKEELCADLWGKQKFFFDILAKKKNKVWNSIKCRNIDGNGYLSIHNIQASLCEFRKYNNLKAGFGRRRFYTRSENI